MLVPIVLVGLGEPYGCKSTLQERDMVASPALAVSAIDHHHLHPAHVVFPDRLDESCELPGRRVVLSSHAPPNRRLGCRLVAPHTLGEDPHRPVIVYAVPAGGGSEDSGRWHSSI